MKKQKNKQPTKQPILLYVIVTLLLLTGIVIGLFQLLSKKQTESMPAKPSFTKHGEVTFIRADNTPIVTIDVEIADTDEKREIGLMGRPFLDEKQGMLFLFDKEHYASFWMKNTILPLDILYINKEGVIVTIHQNTTPFSEQHYNATAPTLYVVEVNAHFTTKYNIQTGDRILWHRTQ